MILMRELSADELILVTGGGGQQGGGKGGNQGGGCIGVGGGETGSPSPCLTPEQAKKADDNFMKFIAFLANYVVFC